MLWEAGPIARQSTSLARQVGSLPAASRAGFRAKAGRRKGGAGRIADCGLPIGKVVADREGDDAPDCGQHEFRRDAFAGVAFHPSHLAVAFVLKPRLKPSCALRRQRCREPAVVKAQFNRALTEGFFHWRKTIPVKSGDAKIVRGMIVMGIGKTFSSFL